MELKNSGINETWKLCSLGGFVGLFLIIVIIINDLHPTTIIIFTPPHTSVNTNTTNNETASTSAGPTKDDKCRMFEGRWVYKPRQNPRYHINQCPFVEEKMSCRRNGRPDFLYEGWSWESNDCYIPLFDGKDMLGRLRGKRVILVGDSLNRNQWESLACLLYSSSSLNQPDRQALVNANGPVYKLFQAKEYNFSLEFYWAPFLVHLDEAHKSGKKILSLDKLHPSSEKWRGADVMLFNSGHWWTHNGKLKSWDLFEYEGEQVEQMQTEAAFSRALSTWSKWLAHNVDPTRTRVYFRSISPEHKNKQSCFNASRPIQDESYAPMYPCSMIDVAEGRIREMNGRDGVHVSYLNITKLSSYRRDAHPSIYRYRNHEGVEETMADCSHWCLPGLPDTWNRIFYASLFFDHLSPGLLST